MVCVLPRTYDFAAAIVMYAAGATLKEVAAEHGVSLMTIHSMIKREAPHLLRGQAHGNAPRRVAVLA